jgi:phenylacetate-CoA ligase
MRLLKHAYDNVPYYNQVFKNMGLLELNNTSFPEIERIPILTKEIIRTNHNELVSEDLKDRRWWYYSSGGSTGEPIRFIQDELHEKWTAATVKYYYEKMLGIEETFAKKVFLWGSERDIFEGTIGFRAKVNNWLTNTIFLNSFRMTEKDMADYVDIINKYKPELIKGYTGSLFEISRYIEKHKLTVHSPKIISSHAETLTEEARQKIESTFGTKIYDFYGSREVGPIAGECKEGLMHIFGFNNYVEILDGNDSPVKEGHGKIVITTLHNLSMPLIRYEIGDTALTNAGRCKCGNPLPTLKKITGRILDHFIREDGTIIFGGIFTILFNLRDWVKAFQIIQEDYKRIRILIVTDKINESDKKDVEHQIRFLMGQDCKIIWEIVDDIPETKSGKHLYIKSLIH